VLSFRPLMPDAFFDLFEWQQPSQGAPRLASNPTRPRSIPCPQTGRPLRVAHVEVSERAVCPSCTQLGAGGYVSFVADLRLAFACPSCRKLVWIAGA
jgi:hypothetical protein